MSVMPTPPARLEASGFVLRAWSPADAPLLEATLAASDAHLRPWTPWVITGKVPGLTLEERLARHAEDWQAGREWIYGIFTSDERELLGGCGLHPRIGPGAVEIGYWLAERATGRGVATAAASLLTSTAFGPPHMERVEIRVEPRNVRSAMVPQRLGFAHAGQVEAHGTTLDVWAMARERWAAGRA